VFNANMILLLLYLISPVLNNITLYIWELNYKYDGLCALVILIIYEERWFEILNLLGLDSQIHDKTDLSC
jgi:hypothetical protein